MAPILWMFVEKLKHLKIPIDKKESRSIKAVILFCRGTVF